MAVSPQLVKFSREFANEKGLTFQILSDPGNVVAAKFKLVFKLPEDLRRVYQGFGIDLPKFNGDDSWTLPMPARFVVDTKGIIQAADVSADYTVRPEPDGTVAIVEDLAGTERGK